MKLRIGTALGEASTQTGRLEFQRSAPGCQSSGASVKNRRQALPEPFWLEHHPVGRRSKIVQTYSGVSRHRIPDMSQVCFQEVFTGSLNLSKSRNSFRAAPLTGVAVADFATEMIKSISDTPASESLLLAVICATNYQAHMMFSRLDLSAGPGNGRCKSRSHNQELLHD